VRILARRLAGATPAQRIAAAGPDAVAMSVLRTVGGAWLGVHAPASPRAMLIWLLDRGFRGLLPGPGPRAVDWTAVARARENLPVTLVALRSASLLTPLSERAEAGIASANESERERAIRALGETVALARALGTRDVILEPGRVRVPGEPGPTDLGDTHVAWTKEKAAAWIARRNAVLDRALDAACRTLHRACRAFPDVRFVLTGSADLLGLGEPQALGAIFADLRNLKLGYWHDASVAARREQLLGVSQGEWLHDFADRLAGVTVTDCGEGSLYGVPGSGRVDYPLIASYRMRGAKGLPVALELDPGIEPGELPGALAFLDKFGL